MAHHPRSWSVRRAVRLRFWFEAGLGAGSMAAFVLTLLVPDWIEVVFGVDPDHHSGAWEWVISAGLLVAAVVFGALARREWRRPLPASP